MITLYEYAARGAIKEVAMAAFPVASNGGNLYSIKNASIIAINSNEFECCSRAYGNRIRVFGTISEDLWDC